ncbi:hypothetical protein D1872_325510 [compost metagenome]
MLVEDSGNVVRMQGWNVEADNPGVLLQVPRPIPWNLKLIESLCDALHQLVLLLFDVFYSNLLDVAYSRGKAYCTAYIRRSSLKALWWVCQLV